MTSATQPTRVAFVGGSGRSGSTLLERMLAGLPGVCALGEVVHIWRRSLIADELCGCGRSFSQCDFWQEIGTVAFGGWHEVNPQAVLGLKAQVDRSRYVPLLAGPLLSDRRQKILQSYLDYYERIYAAARTVSGAAVVVDSSKHPSLALCLRRSDLVDLRVLHIVRDSPGVAYSWSKQVRRPEVAGAEAWMPQYGTTRAVVDWWFANGVLAVLEGSQDDRLVVRYEELISKPQATVRRISAHCGLDLRDGDLGFVSHDSVLLSAGHSVAGNPMRFQSGRIPLRPDDAWRTRMPRSRRQAVKIATAPLRRHFGYGRSNPTLDERVSR